jgi:hypothetical protein
VQLRWGGPRPGTRTASRATTYADVRPGQVGLVVDSYGLLAVSVPRGSAAETLGVVAGDEMSLVPLGEGADEPAADPPGASSPVTLQPRRPS